MTTKQVLELACVFLAKEELLESEYFVEEGDTLSLANENELNLLLRCLNLIISEISTEYIPIYDKASISLENGEKNLIDISNNMFEIISVENSQGEKIRYKCYGDKLYCNENHVVVKFTKFATECSLESNVECFNSKMPARVLAYGVCMEYSLISSCYEDAEIWEKRYKNSLLSLANKKHERVTPKRRWF